MVVDTSALVAIIRKESDGDMLFRLLLESRGGLISAGTLQETMIVLAGKEIDPDELRELLDIARLWVVPVDDALARLAADAFIRFGKGRHPARLNFGDCFAYALAKARDLPLLFKGEDFSKTDIRDARIALA